MMIVHSLQCCQRMAILLLQLWQGCQVCVKISTQLPQFNKPAEFTLGYQPKCCQEVANWTEQLLKQK